MASGEYLLNTWYAKRILGDNAASAYTDALLQTGASIAADTWIFNQNAHSTAATTLYGIKYGYDSTNAEDTLEFFGSRTKTVSDVVSAIPSIKFNLKKGFIYSSSIYPTTINTGGKPDLGSEDYGWNHLYIRGTTVNSHAIDGANPFIEFSNDARTQYMRLIYTDNDNQGDDQSLALIGNDGNTVTWIKASGFVTNARQKVKSDDVYAGIVLKDDGTMHLSQGASSTETANKGGYIGFHYNGDTAETSYLQGVDGAVRANPKLTVNTDTYSWALGARTTTKTDFAFAVNGNGFIKNTIYTNIGLQIHRNATGEGIRIYQTNETSSQQYAALQINTLGTTDAVGRAQLTLGNELNSGTDKNANGRIQIYQSSTNPCYYYPESWSGNGTQNSYTFIGQTSTTADEEKFTYLILGNNKSVDSTDAHSEGRIRIYGNLTYYHDIRSGSVLARSSDTYQAAQASADSDNRIHYLHNANSYLLGINIKAAITMDSNKWAKADWNAGTQYLVGANSYGYGNTTDIARIARRVYVTVNEETGKIPTGYSQILLGNNIAAESAANAYGSLVLYGTGTKYTNLRTAQTTADNTMYLPNYNGTGYLVHTSGTAAEGGQYNPVYIAANGRATQITAGTTAQFYRGDKTWSNDLAGRLTVDGLSTSADIIFDSTGASGTTGTSAKITWSGSTDGAQIYYDVPASDQGNLVINMTDDANARISLRTQGTERIGIDSNGTYVNTQLQRAGKSVSWFQGRNTAIIKTTSYSGYDAILSMKTTNGDWSQGVYSSNIMYWTYITDTNYNANTNTITSQMYLTSEGHLHLSYGNLYIHKANSGIYFTGTKATHRMIRFLDNTSDVNGNGISIGGGGLTILGSGESADTIVTNVASAGGTETTYIASDNNIQFYPGQNSYDASALISMSPSRIWAGVNGNTTREAQVGVQSGAGQVYLWSAAATGGDRGLYITAHGSGGSFAILRANTNNSVTILGHDTWGGKVRITDNWVGFYSAHNNTGTRYGYIQANADRMYFRKENGVSSYGFDFNSHLYTTGNYYAANNGPCYICFCQDFTSNTSATNGLSANREQGMVFYNKNAANWLGDFKQGYTQSNGQMWQRMYIRNYKTDGTNVNNYIYLYANKDGTTSYSIANQAAFRDAITAPSKTGGGASGTWGISVTGSSASCTGNAATASKVGAAASWLYFNNSNEVNFGGTNTSTTIYYGYRATDSRGKPTAHVFGSGNGTATVKAGALYSDGTLQIGADSVTYHWVMGGGSSYAWCDVRNASNTVLQNIVVYSTYMQFREIRANAVKNAVWNDYAEYRLAETEEPGRVVIPYSDKVARLSNARLQAGGRIISDTYGNVVGQNDTAKTPVGLAGRVLAYPYRDKSEYNIGDAVCSAPNGTVDKMTRDEIMMYPDRILGIVNEIPDYEVWESTLTYEAGRGKVTQQVQVKGRIWIDIK